MEVTWTELKQFLDARGVSAQWVEFGNRYWIKAFDGPFELSCSIKIEESPGDDQVEFENDYQSKGNKTPNLQVITQYELNDKDLKLARSYAAIDSETQKALINLKVPGTFGTDGRYITGGYGTTEDYDKDDYALVWVQDDDRLIAWAEALGANPDTTEPLSDAAIQGMDVVPGFGIAMPNYPIVKKYYDEEADPSNQGWYFWPCAQGNDLPPVGETEVETIAGFAYIPSGLYLKIQYCRIESKTTGGIRVNFFWGRKG